jgi:hypothetical protein
LYLVLRPLYLVLSSLYLDLNVNHASKYKAQSSKHGIPQVTISDLRSQSPFPAMYLIKSRTRHE